jgi:hypothetical protein
VGVYSSLLSNPKTFSSQSRVAHELRVLASRHDPDPEASQPISAVHTFPQWLNGYTSKAGNTPGIELAFILASGEAFSVHFAYNQTSGGLESEINVAATAAAISGWTNRDIDVSGPGDLITGGPFTLTYSGDSVTGQLQPVPVADPLGLFVELSNNPAQLTPGNGSNTSEVQGLIGYAAEPTAGSTFDLSFSLDGDGPVTIAFTVSEIPYDVTAAQLETLIDAAAVAAGYATWSGEISVAAVGGSGSNLVTAGYFTFTYGNGLLVQFADHDLLTVDWSNIIPASPYDDLQVTRTVAGQGSRPAWGALLALGIVSEPLPAIDAAADAYGFTQVVKGPNANRLQPWFIRELVQEAAFEDSNRNTYRAVISAIGWDDRSPLIP